MTSSALVQRAKQLHRIWNELCSINEGTLAASVLEQEQEVRDEWVKEVTRELTKEQVETTDRVQVRAA